MQRESKWTSSLSTTAFESANSAGNVDDDIKGLRKHFRGYEQLLTQLLGFGDEKHDHAVDAVVYLILGLVGDGIEEQKVHYI
jgi:hypothetical protein